MKVAGEDGRLCHETIYQFIYGPEGRALELHRHLLRARRLRRRRFGRKPRGLKIPLARTIAQRPAEIGERHAVGHWEADLLIFRRAHGRANVTSLVERRSHGVEAYFCDPHSPWQKGSVENANGRLRRFLPGELDLSTLTPARLHEIERQMNATPRKCLGFRTPHEAFAAALG